MVLDVLIQFASEYRDQKGTREDFLGVGKILNLDSEGSDMGQLMKCIKLYSNSISV